MSIHYVKCRLLLCALIMPLSLPLDAVELKFHHRTGEQWHITATVQEEVLLNGELLYESEILNRIAAEVLSSKGGQGTIAASYRIAERFSEEETYIWSVDLTSQFDRDEQGRISLHDPQSIIPPVRNIPFFPNYSLNPGDSWSSQGIEVFDLAPHFGINEFLPMEVSAQYVYEGPQVKDGHHVEMLTIQYDFDWFLRPGTPEYSRWPSPRPQFIEGNVEIRIWWDLEAGKPYASEGMFQYNFFLDNAEFWSFRGLSKGESTFTTPMDKDALTKEIEQIDNVGVEVVDEGVKVILEDILFFSNRADMLPQETKKLQKIGHVLEKYPGRDIMITGHTARVSGETGQLLSEERAAAVAKYFLHNGIRRAEEVVIRGMGARQPVGDNRTEQGRQKNRRVEIIIMEN